MVNGDLKHTLAAQRVSHDARQLLWRGHNVITCPAPARDPVPAHRVRSDRLRVVALVGKQLPGVAAEQ